ncbi:hypothetical protein ABZ769_00790 [Streptomyces olivoreticuli]
MEDTTVGRTAFMLIGHPPARRQNETPEVIRQQMHNLGASLGLGAAQEKLRRATCRVMLLGNRHTRAVLLIQNSRLFLRLPVVGAEWARTVHGGGPVFIVLTLPALPPLADHHKVAQFAAESIGSGQCMTGLSGITGLRDRVAGQAPPSATDHPADKDPVSRRKFITCAAGITRPLVPPAVSRPSRDVSAQALTPAKGPLK